MKLFVVENRKSKKPVFFRYHMDARGWDGHMDPVPYDVKDFNDGIESYSNGMALITEAGFRIVSLLRSVFILVSS